MITREQYPEEIKKYIDDRRKMLSDGLLSDDFTVDFTQAKTLIESLNENDKND